MASGVTSLAIAHEWLVGWGGSESVVQSFARLFPDAPIQTLVYDPDPRVARAFPRERVRTTPLQRLPGVGAYYPLTLPLMPGVWRRTRLEGFDVILSSSHAFAKGVARSPGSRHVCYCHTPPRYLWDLSEAYLGDVGSRLARPLMGYLRRRDREAAANVDTWIANSHFVADRVHRIYGEEAQVVYPPVDVDTFGDVDEGAEAGAAPTGDLTPGSTGGDAVGAGKYYLAGGRLVRYKRVDRAVEAANKAGLSLVVFGDGPERARLEAMAGPTIRFTGAVSPSELRALFSHCRAYLFPGIEDFGILPVEAQAAGRPVVALGIGGAAESVVHLETGVLYQDDSVEGLLGGVEELEARSWDVADLRHNARRFSRARFEDEILGVVTGER